MSRSIIPFNYEEIHGQYASPEYQNGILDERTITAIKNAWNNFSIIDQYGRIWINSEGVHIVLRTTKDNASYLIAGLPNDQRFHNGNNLFIKGESICYLLDSNIQNARSILRENYIKYSQLLYIAIRDCSRARELRAERYEYLRKVIKTLKLKRINLYSITKDELTGDNLHASTAEFSHIRSVALFPHLASFVENGLILNNRTHKEITSNSINDERELFQLCNHKGWNTDWYHRYLGFIQVEN